MFILPNSAGTSDIEREERHRASRQRYGHNFEVLGCYQYLAIREFHVLAGVPDSDTRHKKVPKSKQCII